MSTILKQVLSTIHSLIFYANRHPSLLSALQAQQLAAEGANNSLLLMPSQSLEEQLLEVPLSYIYQTQVQQDLESLRLGALGTGIETPLSMVALLLDILRVESRVLTSKSDAEQCITPELIHLALSMLIVLLCFRSPAYGPSMLADRLAFHASEGSSVLAALLSALSIIDAVADTKSVASTGKGLTLPEIPAFSPRKKSVSGAVVSFGDDTTSPSAITSNVVSSTSQTSVRWTALSIHQVCALILQLSQALKASQTVQQTQSPTLSPIKRSATMAEPTMKRSDTLSANKETKTIASIGSGFVHPGRLIGKTDVELKAAAEKEKGMYTIFSIICVSMCVSMCVVCVCLCLCVCVFVCGWVTFVYYCSLIFCFFMRSGRKRKGQSRGRSCQRPKERNYGRQKTN